MNVYHEVLLGKLWLCVLVIWQIQYMYNFIFIRYTFWCKDKYNREWHILMEYEYVKILIQGDGGVQSIIIKKSYVPQIKVERTSVNFKIEGIWGA